MFTGLGCLFAHNESHSSVSMWRLQLDCLCTAAYIHRCVNQWICVHLKWISSVSLSKWVEGGLQWAMDVDVWRVATLPFCAAEQVLEFFHARFITEVASNDVIHDLKHRDIITDGVFTEVRREPDATRQNEILYEHLETTSTWEALMTVCDVIIAVRGNPRMKRFGEDMKRMLKGEWCARPHMHTACMCSVCTCTAHPTSVSSLQSALDGNLVQKWPWVAGGSTIAAVWVLWYYKGSKNFSTKTSRDVGMIE